VRILIAGASGGPHLGGSFHRAAAKLGFEAQLFDINQAWQHGTLYQKLLWHLGGRRPARMRRFGRQLIELCQQLRPQVLVATGMSPLSTAVLLACQRLGLRCVNFSTDDPFSGTHRAAWFFKALRQYDVVFSPRRANLEDLRRHGCRDVAYLPFGYDPDLFHPPAEPVSPEMESDLFFAGAADRGRVPFVAAALQSGIKVRLHGTYWDRYPETRGASLGQADIPTLRQAIRGCRVALCVVRHENRDGHAMRTFEIPAVGACMVVEDTAEHRAIFGPDGETVCYFRTPQEMVAKTSWLLDHPAERERLRSAVHARIIRGHNTYADRLQAMIQEKRQLEELNHGLQGSPSG